MPSSPGVPQRAHRLHKPRCCEHAQHLPRVCKFPGSAARAPPRPLCPPPALAHPPVVRLRRLGDRHFRAGPGPLGVPPLRGAVWAGRPGAPECGSSGRSAAAGLSHLSQPASPPPPRAMAGSSSLEAVRRKIRSLQEQADAAEERAGSLQRELDYERKLRETVRDPPIAHPPPPRGASAADGPTARCRALQSPSTPAPTPPGRTWRTWGSWRLALGRGPACSFQPCLSIVAGLK